MTTKTQKTAPTLEDSMQWARILFNLDKNNNPKPRRTLNQPNDIRQLGRIRESVGSGAEQRTDQGDKEDIK